MKCEDLEILLHAHLDNELDAANSQAVMQHLTACPHCQAKADEFAELSRTIKSQVTRQKAPAALRTKLSHAPQNAERPARWAGLGAAVSIAACLLLFIAIRPDESALQQQLVTSHIRSLQDGHLTDVISTDQHTVKPWFNGKSDISPPVVDLKTDGFPLVGGRLDYIDGHQASVLVYRANSHVINLYIWHQAESIPDLNKTKSHQGYNMRHWQRNDLQYWAVSDVNPTHLGEFERIYIERTQ